MNPTAIFKIMELKKKFNASHPKFGAFLKAASKDIRDGSIITISVMTPEGEEKVTNLKVNSTDLQLIEELKTLAK